MEEKTRGGVVLDAAMSIRVKDMAWEGNLSEIVRIDMNNLNEELARQPGLVSWFGVVAVEAVDEVETIKNQISSLKEDQDTLYADLDLLMRKENVKKPTEAEIKSMVTAHPKYRELVKTIQTKRDEMQKASLALNRLTKILIALEHKRDMLVQISANSRKEIFAGDYGRGN